MAAPRGSRARSRSTTTGSSPSRLRARGLRSTRGALGHPPGRPRQWRVVRPRRPPVRAGPEGQPGLQASGHLE
eukprot:8718883-Pyramimonas_sp.AAC.1